MSGAINAPAMAEDLELKMKNLVEGYEQLETISSKLPSSILHMASKHSKNLLGEVDILTPKDHEDFIKQQETLGKVRQDLQGMAYERVVIDVLTRDAILNAKRKNRSLNKPPSSRFGKSPASPKDASLDIDSPIPIKSYPNAARPPADKRNPLRQPNDKSGNMAKQNPSATQMQVGALPAAIQGLKTSPDNTTRYRRGKAPPKATPTNKKYRHLNEPTKIPRVDKGVVEPETLLTYALASKKQDASDKAMRKLIAMQDNQAKEMSALRALVQQMAEHQDQEAKVEAPPPLQGPGQQRIPQHPSYSQEVDDLHQTLDYYSDDDIDAETLSQYKVITVSKAGFKSAPSPPPILSTETTPIDMNEIAPEQVNYPLSESNVDVKTEGDVEYQLVIDPSGESGWVPKAVNRLPAPQKMQIPAPYATPSGGRVTSGQMADQHDIEDGHTYDHYVNMYSNGRDEKDALIVVDGQQTALGARNMILPYKPSNIRSPLPVSTRPPPSDFEAVQVVNIAADTTTTGMDFPRGYTYTSKVMPWKKAVTPGTNNVEKEETIEKDIHESEEGISEEEFIPSKLGDEKEQEEDETSVMQVPDSVDNAQPTEGALNVVPNVDKDLMSLLHELVQTQQSTMQGHNELILALLSQQSRPAPVDTSTQDVIRGSQEVNISTTAGVEMPPTVQTTPEQLAVMSTVASPEKPCATESVSEVKDEEVFRDEENPSSTSFGNLLKKGPAAYSQSPSDVANVAGAGKSRRVMPSDIMESEVLPYYNEPTGDTVSTVQPVATSNSRPTTDSTDATQAIAGVLLGVLQQLVTGQGGAITIPTAFPATGTTSNTTTPNTTAPALDNKYHGDTGNQKEYLHEEPSDQRGQNFAPSEAWAKPKSCAWVNASLPRSPSDREKMQASGMSSVSSWDEDYHSANSDIEDDYSCQKHPPQGIKRVDAYERTVDKADPTLTMLRRDIEESKQHQSALLRPHNIIRANNFENSGVDESWDVNSHVIHSSDSSLGSYHSLDSLDRKRGDGAQRPSGDRHQENEPWSENFNDGVRSPAAEAAVKRRHQRPTQNSLDDSIELPVPLCSSILPCAATLHYANCNQPQQSKRSNRNGPSRHRHTIEEEFPRRDPNHRVLRLDRKHRPNDSDNITLSTYSSADSDDHIPSFRQSNRPSYRPTLSDYEPSTPSSSTVSSLGSVKSPRPSSAVRNKYEKQYGSEVKSQAAGKGSFSAEERDSRSSSDNSVDSRLANYARFVDDSSIDESDESGAYNETRRGCNKSSADDSSSCAGSSSMDTYNSDYSSISGLSGNNGDMTLPRSKLRLWRPPASIKTGGEK